MMERVTTEYIEKMTPDLVQGQIERLRQLFPECVAEGQVDFDLLRATLGDADALADENAYTFTWAGKQEAFRAIQTPSGASLAPAPDESVDWDETRHLFIEGENLEVLKLLYKSYFGKVKMIYIDPPYNTGSDFIYRDDYGEPRRAYLEKTGQMDAEGNVLTSNPETSGRYHSDWLTMMYPRLFVARQLLREDGVIFVSIDDNEVHNLRLMMNDIFGEENFVETLVWQKRATPPNDRIIGRIHEYILVYRKSEYLRLSLLPRPKRLIEKYQNPDNDPRGRWAPNDLSASGKGGRFVESLVFPIVNPDTGEEHYPPEGKCWLYNKEKVERYIDEGRIGFRKTTGTPFLKRYLSEVRPGVTCPTMLDDCGYSLDSSREVEQIFGKRGVFEFPKPLDLMKRLLHVGASRDGEEIVLDLFGGSCALAQAVLQMNREDKCRHRFIMVQLPESVPGDSVAREEGYKTVADIGKERIRRVIARMQEGDEDGQLSLDLQPDQDLGFKVFKLASSTFREWEPPEDGEGEALGEQLSLFDRGLKEDADPRHVIYEVILKLGYSLNSNIEPLDVESNRVYRVVDEVDGTGKADQTAASFYICLEDELQDETIDSLPLDKETTFVCLDTALDDSQKVNLAMGCLLKVI